MPGRPLCFAIPPDWSLRRLTLPDGSAYVTDIFGPVHLHLESIRIEELERLRSCRVCEFPTAIPQPGTTRFSIEMGNSEIVMVHRSRAVALFNTKEGIAYAQDVHRGRVLL